MNQIRIKQGNEQRANVEAPDAACSVSLVLPRENLSHDPSILSVLSESVACFVRQNGQRTTGAFQAEYVACNGATTLLAAPMGATGRSWMVRLLHFAQKSTTTLLVWQPEESPLLHSCVLPPDGCLVHGGPVGSAFVVVVSSDHSQLPVSIHVLNAVAAFWYQKSRGRLPATFGVDGLAVLPQHEQLLLAASGAHGQGWMAQVHEGEQTADVLVWVSDVSMPASSQKCLEASGRSGSGGAVA